MGSKLIRAQTTDLGDLRLGGVILLFDREFGPLFFQNFKGYGNLLDDAEWLLERTPQRSWGFMIRPIIRNEFCGLWIGEYGPLSNRVVRGEMLFDRNSSGISRILLKYANNEISESEVARRLTIKSLKRMLPGSMIIRDFKYYICPMERFYKDCPHIEKIYRAVRERYGAGARIRYSIVADIIFGMKPCDDVIICPLLSSPNRFESIIRLNMALRSRRLGEIKIIERSLVEII